MTYTERFDEALTWASELHRQQSRKGKEDVPYIRSGQKKSGPRLGEMICLDSKRSKVGISGGSVEA